jgi:murein DD-endopeptidase MepM/ murein hydrolase activator NlpD
MAFNYSKKEIQQFYKAVLSIRNIDFSSVLRIKKNLIYFFLFFFVLTFFIFSNNQITTLNKDKEKNLDEVLDSSEFLNLKSYFLNTLISPYIEYKYIIKNNDSIEKILKDLNIDNNEIKLIVTELKKRKLSNIYAGRQINIVTKKVEEEEKIISILYPVSNTLSIEVRKNGDLFSIRENIIKLNKKEVVVKNTIKNSLYSAAVEKGIEPNIIVEFARIYGFEIDFQRDIRKDDWFEIYYEKFVDDNGVVKDTGKIIYASMFVNNKEINLYNFKYKNETGYYDLNGRSIVKSLMKTPINGARLSSSFGNRKHPILGYTKLHAGTDFAAPSGTPIMASGSGTVTRAKWCGGGGNCIKIKHNSTYQTIYAHMKSFAKGVKVGKKVKQGQIIGYVGSTGMSTGPHLHYEVIVNGKKVNSQRLKLPSAKRLDKIARKDFEIKRIKIDLKLSELRYK